MKVIIAKMDWEAMRRGQLKSLRLYKPGELHHEFGDTPWNDVIEVHIIRNPRIKIKEERMELSETAQEQMQDNEGYGDEM